jgi:hypothetical protein
MGWRVADGKFLTTPRQFPNLHAASASDLQSSYLFTRPTGKVLHELKVDGACATFNRHRHLSMIRTLQLFWSVSFFKY